MEEQSPRYPDDSPAHGQSGPDPPSLQRHLWGGMQSEHPSLQLG